MAMNINTNNIDVVSFRLLGSWCGLLILDLVAVKNISFPIPRNKPQTKTKSYSHNENSLPDKYNRHMLFLHPSVMMCPFARF